MTLSFVDGPVIKCAPNRQDMPFYEKGVGAKTVSVTVDEMASSSVQHGKFLT